MISKFSIGDKCINKKIGPICYGEVVCVAFSFFYPKWCENWKQWYPDCEDKPVVLLRCDYMDKNIGNIIGFPEDDLELME